MRSKFLPVVVRAVALGALALPLACDGGGEMAGQPGDDRLFVPAGLSNTNIDGQDDGPTLIAFTLVQEGTGPKLYAAVKNNLDTPACEAGMTTYFVDKADQVVTSSGSVLLSGRLYRLSDGTIISCIDPGQVAMTASTDLPSTLMIDDLGFLEHLFPTFIVAGIVPTAGLTVSEVHAVATGAGHAYSGTVTNGLDVTVSAPAVAIFPVNRVGRPLGVATGSATVDLPPGGSWTFETSVVDDLGVDYLAYPTASIAQ